MAPNKQQQEEDGVAASAVLTPEKLLSMLQAAEGTEAVELLEHQVRAGAKKGENYCGELKAVRLVATVGPGKARKEYHWMVKLPNETKNPMSTLAKMDRKEYLMYAEVIPALQRLTAGRGLAFDLHFPGTPYLEWDAAVPVLAMENMKAGGWEEPRDKFMGLGKDYVEVAMDALARFHAYGYAYLNSYEGGLSEGLEKNHDVVTDYLMNEPEEGMVKIIDAMMGNAREICRQMLNRSCEPGQDFGEILNDFEEETPLLKRTLECYKVREGRSFNTLCHGDSWFNNMLFRHDKDPQKGKEVPTACLLLDLAITRYGNPAGDLSYFFFHSVTPSLRRTHMRHFLERYHATFTSTMHKLGCDPSVYTFSALESDYKEQSFIGFTFGLFSLPSMLAKPEDAMSGDDFILNPEDEEQSKAQMKQAEEKMFQAFDHNPQIRLMLAGNFEEMLNYGHFDKFRRE